MKRKFSEAEVKSIIADIESRHDFMKRGADIYAIYKANMLPPVFPCWHLTKQDIELSKQRGGLRKDLLEDGYTIIDNVDIEKVVSNLGEVDAQVYYDRNLYRENFERHRISSVIDYWLHKTKLIPTTIVVRDSLISKNCPDTEELMAADGKHRLNVAYYFGTKTIPIFVINKQLEKVKRILGISI